MTDKNFHTKYMGFSQYKTNPIRRIDIRFVPYDAYYSALLYFTGSNIFNIGIRHYVKINFDLSLSEHGFGKNINTSINSEENIFKFLKLKYVKPKERDNFYI